MNFTHKSSLLTLATLATLAAPPVLAQGEPYFYGGLGVGQSQTHVDGNRITESQAGSGFAVTNISRDERSTAYKGFLGYQFNRSIGMELGYFHLGTFRFNADTNPAGSLEGRFRVQGASLDAVGTLPFTEQLSGIGKVGAQYARTRANFASSGGVPVSNPNPSDRKLNPKFGLGLQYAVNPSVVLRAEAERMRISDAVNSHPMVSLYTVSVLFPFGRSETPAPRTTRAPAYVAPVAAAPIAAVEPMPELPPPAAPVAVAPVAEVAPVVAVAPIEVAVEPTSRRVSYAAESFFGFDRSDLRPEGKAALDTFAAELGNTNFDSITVQGHADRFGSTAYNQTLSMERAEAVKAYLVTMSRLDPGKIEAVGRSESEPVTLPDACKGPMSAMVIACLQPDRRVEIEVSGTR
jgi:OmpA-OmpF porin, OOP family